MTLTVTARSAAHAVLLHSSRVTLRPAPFRPVRGAVRTTKTSTMALSQDELKKQAAHRAVEYVKSGMVLGLGTGSTTAFAIDRIGELMEKGELKDIVGVPTSIKSYEQASGKMPDSCIRTRHTVDSNWQLGCNNAISGVQDSSWS